MPLFHLSHMHTGRHMQAQRQAHLGGQHYVGTGGIGQGHNLVFILLLPFRQGISRGHSNQHRHRQTDRQTDSEWLPARQLVKRGTGLK